MEKVAYDETYINWEWGTRPFGDYDEVEKEYYLRDILSRSCTSEANALEIGYGNGRFISCARDAGFRITGVEINEVLIRKAQQAGFRVFHSLDRITEDGCYDLIVALDVLEHLTAPQAKLVLGDVFRLLRPGGVFVARFPNGDSPLGRVYQNGDVTHVSAIGRGKIEYYCSIIGFELEYIGDPVRIEGAGLRRKAKRVLANGARRAIEWTFGKLYFERTIPFNLNYLVVLRKPADAAKEPEV